VRSLLTHIDHDEVANLESKVANIWRQNSRLKSFGLETHRGWTTWTAFGASSFRAGMGQR